MERSMTKIDRRCIMVGQSDSVISEFIHVLMTLNLKIAQAGSGLRPLIMMIGHPRTVTPLLLSSLPTNHRHCEYRQTKLRRCCNKLCLVLFDGVRVSTSADNRQPKVHLKI